MGGGEGAKERRRLKRLSETAKPATTNGGERVRNINVSQRFRNNDDATKGPAGTRKKFTVNNSKKSGGPPVKHKKKKTETTTKKIKKPKHLKRKLEQAEEDTEEREKLLGEITTFNEKKEKFCQQPLTKRPKQHDISEKQHDDHRPAKTRVKEKAVAAPMKETRRQSVVENQQEPESDDEEMRPSESSDEPQKEPDTVALVSKPKRVKSEPLKEPDTVVLVSKPERMKPKPQKELDTVILVSKTKKTKVNNNDESSQKEPGDGGVSKTKRTKSSNNESEGEDDSDSDESMTEKPRQRGRRRRGRKDTAKQIEESSQVVMVTKDVVVSKDVVVTKDEKIPENQEKGAAADVLEREHKEEKKTAESDDGRYCLGRKPVTDFVLGQTYPAKVVYVKPFGVFFDIGCHSDAFCHVSRLRDDYVESPEESFKEGDQVDARVVEIERRKKRITVSLQSEARLEDERASIDARQHRKESIKKRLDKMAKKSDSSEAKTIRSEKEAPAGGSTARIRPTPESFQRTSFAGESTARSRPTPESSHRPSFAGESTAMSRPTPQSSQRTTFKPPDESTMNPAELKRSRKLARRAARREQAETLQ
jgi:predicted RNA-binding protein with RPS1 domain